MRRWPTNSSTCCAKPKGSSRLLRTKSWPPHGPAQMKRAHGWQENDGGNGSGNARRLPTLSLIAGADIQRSKSILPKATRACSSMIVGVPKTRPLRVPISSVMRIWCAICNMPWIKSARSSPIGFNDSCSNQSVHEMPSGRKGFLPSGEKPSSSLTRMS